MNKLQDNQSFRFVKMQALGNDFVIIDATIQQFSATTAFIQRIADRHYGVGCDQVLVLEKSQLANTDYWFRIFNADGGEVGQCGNGARCLAYFLFEKESGKLNRNHWTVSTVGDRRLQLSWDAARQQATVDMGLPSFVPVEVPFRTDREQTHYRLSTAGCELEFGAVNVGNPHVVLLTTNKELVDCDQLGCLISHLPCFPEETNVNWVEVLSRAHLQLRVYERGVGPTLACGSGACASMAVCRRWGLVDDVVQVDQPGGSVQVTWSGQLTDTVKLSGGAQRVFEGIWKDNVAS